MQLTRTGAPVADTDLLLNWLDTLYFHFVPRKLAIVLSLLPQPVRQRLAQSAAGRVVRLSDDLQRLGVKIAFYYHDLQTFSRIPLIVDIDKICRVHFHQHANVVLFAEESARAQVRLSSYSARPSYICPLGSFRDYHGPLLDANDARSALGIKPNQTVLLALGTLRSNRSIDALVDAISKHDDLFLLAAGRGNRDQALRNARTFGGYSDNERIRALLSCADYVVHTGTDYLTSAVVRVAVSYNIPVVAHRFGSTKDMSQGALIDMGASCDLNGWLNNLPSRNSEAYRLLQEAARARDEERTWDIAADRLLTALQAGNRAAAVPEIPGQLTS